MGINRPTLDILFRKAAETVVFRLKAGVVAVLLKDAKANGLARMTGPGQIPAELGAANQAHLRRAFVGGDQGAPSQVLAVVVPAAGTVAAALTLLGSTPCDYLCGPPDLVAADSKVIADWVIAQRTAYATVKAVLPEYSGDSMGIISLSATDLRAGKTPYTAAEYCTRVAGGLAGIPISSSATGMVLPEITATAPMSGADQDTAINAGKLLLVHDGRKCQIVRAVNSLQTLPAEGREDWRKIKIVEGMDLIQGAAHDLIETRYKGHYANIYDNKLVLLVALQSFLAELEANEVLAPGSSFADIDTKAQEAYLREQGVDTAALTPQALREYDTGSWVFILMGGKLVDAMEDFKLQFDCA